MNSLKLSPDLPEIIGENWICQICQLGKMHRQPFTLKSSWRANTKLELIHTDICGPMSTESLSDNRYFILFIDDHSRMTWIYFLKIKNEALQKFKGFKAETEAESGMKLKCLRSDNGLEFTSTEFKDFCIKEGIKRQLTAPHSPQQNGVSEKKNRTVIEMTRSLLKDKQLPLQFWCEAMNTSVYLLNRLPSRAVEGKTSYECWSGKKPATRHLLVFGSICYCYVAEEKRKKLDDKAEICIFFGL